MVLQMGTVAAGSGALHRVRAITVGGGPMDRDALARAERSLGTTILRVFGMSECLGHTSPRPDDPPALRLGTDGIPFPGTELRAVASYPRGEQACVVPVQDDVVGERVALLAVSSDGGEIGLDEVTGYLGAGGLSKTKWPEFVFVVEALPKTRVGKLDRTGARELARSLWAGGHG